MFKHILVAVDGSETSDAALHTALALARKLGSRLRMVYVADELQLSMDCPAELGEEWRKAIANEGHVILKRAKSAAQEASVEADTKLLEAFSSHGRISKVVVDEAESWHADLIVVGTHGRRGLDRVVMGSVAEGVARTASMPVLLVRDRERAERYAHMLDLPIMPD